MSLARRRAESACMQPEIIKARSICSSDNCASLFKAYDWLSERRSTGFLLIAAHWHLGSHY